MRHKSSKQRSLMLAYIRQYHGHVTAEQVFDVLNKTEKVISLATIYRNLNILTEMKEIKKIAHPTYGYVYDKTVVPHYHLHCTKCDQIVDLPIAYQNSIDELLSKDSGVKIQSHMIMAEGICLDCIKDEKKH